MSKTKIKVVLSKTKKKSFVKKLKTKYPSKTLALQLSGTPLVYIYRFKVKKENNTMIDACYRLKIMCLKTNCPPFFRAEVHRVEPLPGLPHQPPGSGEAPARPPDGRVHRDSRPGPAGCCGNQWGPVTHVWLRLSGNAVYAGSQVCQVD